MVGFASDGAGVMVGKHNSVVSRLKTEIPTLMVFMHFPFSSIVCIERMPVAAAGN